MKKGYIYKRVGTKRKPVIRRRKKNGKKPLRT